MKIFCSGIGGIGVSAYAALQAAQGHEVSGSDRSLSAVTADLRKQGISVTDDQSGAAVPEDADLFVYSEAIPKESHERVRAREYEIREASYFEALGDLSKEYRVIAVCGTHGKSSTTAMAAKVLVDTGKDPTVVVGTKVPQLHGRNWWKGESDLFLLEACEYRGSFLHLHPEIILMTNVDGDHFDAFPTMEAYRKAFVDFLLKLPANEKVITHLRDDDCRAVVDAVSKQRSDIRVIDADEIPFPDLIVPGTHMKQNAQLVMALAKLLSVDAAPSLREFSGTWRRSEKKGEFNGIPIIDDYAHHPKEVRATLQSMREAYPDRRIVCLFQPHMQNRLQRLYNDFLGAFSECNEILLTDVYDARPDADAGFVDLQRLASDLGSRAKYVGDLKEAESFCRKNLQRGDLLLVMGAGDVTGVAERLVQ